MQNPRTIEEISREDGEELGPGSLENLGSSEWLRKFIDRLKKPPRYNLSSNKGSFLAGLWFMLKRFHEGFNAKEIMMALQDKHRDYSLTFVQKIVGGTTPPVVKAYLTPAEVELINERVATVALVLEFNRMGKTIAFIRERLQFHGQVFPDDFIQELIRNEKQWELETLVDIHRQECVQSMSSN